MSDLAICNAPPSHYATSPLLPVIEVMPGRRRGDTEWLVIQIKPDGSRATAAFSSEADARAAAADRALGFHNEADDNAACPTLHYTEFALRKPAWWMDSE